MDKFPPMSKLESDSPQSHDLDTAEGSNTLIDWERERQQFAVTKNCVYFMNAATTPFRKEVFEASQKFLDRLYFEGDPSWDPSQKIVKETKAQLGQLLNVAAENFAFGLNTNMNMGLLALAFKDRFIKTGNIIVSKDEFPSSYIPWKYVGFEIRFLSSHDKIKNLSQAVEENIDENTRAVISSTVHSLTGERVNISQLSSLCERKNIPLILNATQSLSLFPLDLSRLPSVVAMVATAFKGLGAGYGASVLYINPQWFSHYRWPIAGLGSFDDPDFVGCMEQKIQGAAQVEVGSRPFPAIRALNAALKEILRLGVSSIEQRILALSMELELKCKVAGLTILSPCDKDRKSQIVCIEDSDAKKRAEQLQQHNILVNERRGALRVSLHYYNNSEDIDKFIKTLVELR